MKRRSRPATPGTARVGISVERQSPRNRKTTRATSTKASNRVWSTFSIEAFQKRRDVVTSPRSPYPEETTSSLISSSCFLTSSITVAALEPGTCSEDDGRRGIAVHVRVKVVERRAQLDFGDVLELQDLAVEFALRIIFSYSSGLL